MAAPGIERLGMTAVAASELATLFADKCSITELLAVEAVLNQYAALDTPLTLKDWCSCFLHEPQLLNTEPQVLEQHIKQLGKLFGRHNDELKDVILGCPALLLQDVQQTAEKLLFLHSPGERDLVLQQPHLLTDSHEALQQKLSTYGQVFGGMQQVLRVSSAAPELFTLDANTLQSRHQQLHQLVAGQYNWRHQWTTAAPGTLAAWIMNSELAQQRLSVASSSPYLRKLDLSEVLDSSEVDWQEHVDAAGVMNHTNHQSQGNGYLQRTPSPAAANSVVDRGGQSMISSGSSSNWEVLGASPAAAHDDADTNGVAELFRQNITTSLHNGRIASNSSRSSSMTCNSDHIHSPASAAHQHDPAASAARRGLGGRPAPLAAASPRRTVAPLAVSPAKRQQPSRSASASSSKSMNRHITSPAVSPDVSSTAAGAAADTPSQTAANTTANNTAGSSSSSSNDTERREAFMSMLLSRVPSYAITLLGTDQADKLQFLSNMTPADLSAVLAQPNAEELLEAVYAVHLKKQQQQPRDANNSNTAADNKSSKAGTSTGPGAGSSTAPPATAKPAAAGNAVSSAGSAANEPQVVVDHGRRCVFVEGLVCSVCGSRGHLGSHCRTSHCAACNKYGHATGTCTAACKTCGKKHRLGTCTVPRCTYCKLFGHEFQQCPTAHCKRCGYFGHVPSLCPLGSEQQAAAYTSGSSRQAAAAGKAPTPRTSPAAPGPDPHSSSSGVDGSFKQHSSTAPYPARSPSAVQAAAAPLRVSPQPPAAAAAPLRSPSSAAGPAQSPLVIRDGGRIYKFLRSLVCSRCGKHGHVSELCEVPRCGVCRLYGHRYGDCQQACLTCGRKHAFTRNGGAPVCMTPHCDHCQLFGHIAEDCPSVVCSSCGYWGHDCSRCPTQQQQQQRAGRIGESNISNSQQYSHRSTTPAAAAAVTSPTAAAAANATASSSNKWLMLHDGGRDYRCHQYPTCIKCGTVGHLASGCTMAYCAVCDLYGHDTGHCLDACPTCGKQHEPSPEGCFMPRCPNCQLFGHIGKHCPSARCPICGFYGHIKRICPDQLLRDHNDGHTASSSNNSRQSPTITASSNGYHFNSSRTDQRSPAAVGGAPPGLSAASRPSAAVHSPRSPAVASSAAAAGSSKPSQPPPAAAGGTGKQYRFAGPPVCGRCGRSGHVAAVCHAPYCDSCQKWGHETGCCSTHCRRCGKNHARNGCNQVQCTTCQLWGHAAKNCPAAQCSICGYWGHIDRVCPQAEGSTSTQAAATETGQQGGNDNTQAGTLTIDTAATAGAAVRSPPSGALSNSRHLKLLPPAATAEEAKTRSAWLVRALFDSLPGYASALLGDNDRLTCLARLSADDVGYILAQANPQQLLDAVYTSQQLKQKHERQLQQQEQQRNRHNDAHSSAAGEDKTPGNANMQDGADNSSILMQQMVATLAGFKEESADRGVPVVGKSRLAMYMSPRVPAPEGLLEGSEEEDIGQMLGLLGVRRQQ